MPVTPPAARRVVPNVPGTRASGLVLLALAAILLAVAPSAGAAPRILQKSKIVAPKATGVVVGTLTRKRCSVRFAGATRKVTVKVTGPLSAKKPKTKTLKVRGTRSASCTWRTKSFADGRYRFAATGSVRAGGRWYVVTLKRSVYVRNRVISASSSAEGPQLGAGNARYVGRLESQWDTWLNGADAERQAWMRQHMYGVVAHSTFFDDKTSWAPPALAYKDLYAMYRADTDKLAAHPDWVLKDAAGQRMTIPWGCTPGPCPQFAGDIGNPAFRADWIAEARATLAKGYSGLWIDDANMEMRISDATGAEKPPVDPRTGKAMTYADYRRYMAQFLVEIRRALPKVQLIANVLWFGGTTVGRDQDRSIVKAYTAVDRLNLERGFNDDGLTAGYAPRDIWAVDTFMDFIDRMHDRGIPVTLDSAGVGKESWEYNLAGYFLVDRGNDAIGEQNLAPGEWWSGWDVQLGRPRGDRTRGNDGVFRRSFAKGLVLLNPQQAPTRTITLPRAMKRIDGTTVTQVTLGPARGAVLLPAS